MSRRSGYRSVGPWNWIESLEARAHLAADLSATILFASPASHQVKPGQSIGISIVVTNNGDAAATGNLATALSVSTSADGSSPIPEGTLNKNIHLAPGAHATLRFNTKVPVGFTPGTYFAVADVDPSNTFGETNLRNNVAISANTLIVLKPFPDVVGTWSGPILVKKGVGKGPAGNQVRTFSSVNQTTGAFTFTGTNSLVNGATLNLAGAGNVTTKGIFTDSGSDVPVDAIGNFTDKAKLVGNRLVISFANAINSGTLTLTRIS